MSFGFESIQQIGFGLGFTRGCLFSRVPRISTSLKTDQFPTMLKLLATPEMQDFPDGDSCFIDIPINRVRLESVEDAMAAFAKFSDRDQFYIQFSQNENTSGVLVASAKTIKVHGDAIHVSAFDGNVEGITVISPKEILHIRDYPF